MNKKKRQKLNKLAIAVQEALEMDKREGIFLHNDSMEYMVLNGKPFGTMTLDSEGDYSPNMNIYKWVPPTGYSVKLLGTERFSECSYYYVFGFGNEFCITDNADYSPSSVFDCLSFVDFEDLPHFITIRLAK